MIVSDDYSGVNFIKSYSFSLTGDGYIRNRADEYLSWGNKRQNLVLGHSGISDALRSIFFSPVS